MSNPLVVTRAGIHEVKSGSGICFHALPSYLGSDHGTVQKF